MVYASETWAEGDLKISICRPLIGQSTPPKIAHYPPTLSASPS